MTLIPHQKTALIWTVSFPS